jgi:hypothetical protein
VGEAALALVERVDETDRLQLLAAEDAERPAAMAAHAASYAWDVESGDRM